MMAKFLDQICHISPLIMGQGDMWCNIFGSLLYVLAILGFEVYLCSCDQYAAFQDLTPAATRRVLTLLGKACSGAKI